MAESNDHKPHIGIVGSGLIGGNWAILFSGAGYNVRLFDINAKQLECAMINIKRQLTDMELKGLLKDALTAEKQFSRISGTDSLDQCLQGAKFVQECVPENLELKKEIFHQMEEFVGGSETILSSSTSCLKGSDIAQNLQHKSRIIVSHPVNPPLHCPLVEVIPTPDTDPEVTQMTMNIMTEIGQSPILLKKELPGFALNRIQYAILNECWRLIQDDVVSTEDVDKIMTEGLGRRYAFIGPMETCHLNANGFRDYCDRYGETIYNVSSTFGSLERIGCDLVEKINSDLEQKTSINDIEEKRKWRDDCLMALAALRRNTDKK